jgi:hypothetical protein
MYRVQETHKGLKTLNELALSTLHMKAGVVVVVWDTARGGDIVIWSLGGPNSAG